MKFIRNLTIFLGLIAPISGQNELIFTDNIGSDITIIILVFLISIITTVGGVGGGGLLIPLYLLVGKFELSYAIPLSIVTILGDTTVRMLALFNKKHPLSYKRFLIDLSPLLILVPFDANTSFIGVIMSETIPSSITIFFIVLVLGFTFYKSTRKALETYLKENKFFEEQDNFELVVIDGIGEYFPKSKIEENRNELIENNHHGDTMKNQLLRSFFLFLSIAVISAFSITRTLVPKCQSLYWINIVGQIIVMLIIGFKVSIYIMSDYIIKREHNYIFLEGDIVWDKYNISKFIGIGTITGFLSTYMGIGGGMLITPIMIQVGMIPEVVVATGSISTFFSSLITTINYMIEGKILWSYALTCSLSSALGSLFGLKLSEFILSHLKRQSIIIFLVSLILFMSIILLIFESVSNWDNSFKFVNYCPQN